MHEITRQIQIDAGHRIPDHGSKCKNLHGHRYIVLITCKSKKLVSEGEQKGMVIDFGFLKEELLKYVHDPCDHCLILSAEDNTMVELLKIQQTDVEKVLAENKGHLVENIINTKVLLVPFSPTAENLAKYWYNCLYERLHICTEGQAWLHSVRVYETPNCFSTYTGSD